MRKALKPFEDAGAGYGRWASRHQIAATLLLTASLLFMFFFFRVLFGTIAAAILKAVPIVYAAGVWVVVARRSRRTDT